MNIVMLIGRLGRDPELRYTETGRAVCNMSIATTRRWTKADGERGERTDWHRIVVWGAAAEACKQYLATGRQIAVRGAIQYRQYESDGIKRWSAEIVADRSGGIEFLSNARADKPAEEPAEEHSEHGRGELADDDIPF